MISGLETLTNQCTTPNRANLRLSLPKVPHIMTKSGDEQRVPSETPSKGEGCFILWDNIQVGGGFNSLDSFNHMGSSPCLICVKMKPLNALAIIFGMKCAEPQFSNKTQ